MALTLDRWIAMAIGGAFIALTLILFEPAPGVDTPRNPRRLLVARQEAYSNAARAAAYSLRRIQIRDSLRAAIKPNRDGARIAVGGSFSSDDRVRLNSFLHRIELQRTSTSAAATDQVFIIDTLRTLRGRLIAHGSYDLAHVVPTAGYDRCMSIGMFGGQAVGGRILRYEWFNTTENAARYLGPCAFYDRFGAPGPAIDRWLRAGGWAFGITGMRARQSFASSMPDWYRTPSGYWWGDAGWEFREFITTEGFRCIAGNAAMCRASVVELVSDDRGRRVTEGGFVQSRSYWWNRRALGPWQGSLLADMADRLGDDTFRKFWTSTQAPAEAFAAASGRDLGVWTAEWTRQTYGEIGSGPDLPFRSLAWAVVVLLLALGSAMASFRLRQVA